MLEEGIVSWQHPTITSLRVSMVEVVEAVHNKDCFWWPLTMMTDACAWDPSNILFCIKTMAMTADSDIFKIVWKNQLKLGS